MYKRITTHGFYTYVDNHMHRLCCFEMLMLLSFCWFVMFFQQNGLNSVQPQDNKKVPTTRSTSDRYRHRNSALERSTSERWMSLLANAHEPPSALAGQGRGGKSQKF